jgi:type II secretory ATPase GspE/PulE/Tfp pilus assembly ATPase PilB-like protein
MVGEIRDEETAHIANKAALTGHLVLSTLHTNDAVGTVTRLVDMGVEPYLLSTTLLAVIAQRLVRLNCERCKVEDPVAPYLRQRFGLGSDEKFFRGEGCYQCGFSGYKGRTTICELLYVTPAVAEKINQGSTYQALLEVVLAEGMTRLASNGLVLARAGRTTVDEVLANSTD